MKRSVALILTLLLILACIFVLVACKDGVDGADGKDGKDGVNGINGQDGANGTNGTNGTNGKSAYQLFKEHNPDYSGDEQQWLDDIANGKLADTKYYDILTYGKNLFADITSGSVSSNGSNMTFTNCIAQLKTPVILPTSEDASWQIKIGGTLASSDNGVQLLNSSPSARTGRVYFAANAGKGKVYMGVNMDGANHNGVDGIYFNYCWNVSKETIKSSHDYVIRYSDGLYMLSVDGGDFKNFDSINCSNDDNITANVTNAKEACADFNSKVRAVFGQNFITFTGLGASSFAATGTLGYIQAETSSIYNYQNLGAHPLYGKTIYHLGSSISYGAGNVDSSKGARSFAEQISELTGSVAVKQTVSGTTLSAQRSNSYVDRFANFTFNDNPDFLMLQLSTNDFNNDGITLGTVGTATSNFDTHTTAGAIEYIISETKKKSPNTQVVIYSCFVKDSWKSSHSDYSRFANTELLKLQAKWGVLIVDLYSAKSLLPIDPIMNDAFHANGRGYAYVFTPNMINVMLDYLESK